MSYLTVSDIMTTDVLSVDEAAPVRVIVELFGAHDVGCVPVLRAGRVVGIVTQADVLPLLGFPSTTVFLDSIDTEPRDLLQASAGQIAEDVMTSPAVTVHRENSLIAVARLMMARHLT